MTVSVRLCRLMELAVAIVLALSISAIIIAVLYQVQL